MFCLNFVQSWLQSKTFAAEIKSFWLYSSLLVSWCQYRLISHCSRRFNPHNSRRHNLPQAFCSRSILEPDTVQRKILWVLQSRVFVSKCGVAAGGVVAAALLLPSLSLGIISVGKFRLRCLQQLSSWLNRTRTGDCQSHKLQCDIVNYWWRTMEFLLQIKCSNSFIFSVYILEL